MDRDARLRIALVAMSGFFSALYWTAAGHKLAAKTKRVKKLIPFSRLTVFDHETAILNSETRNNNPASNCDQEENTFRHLVAQKNAN